MTSNPQFNYLLLKISQHSVSFNVLQLENLWTSSPKQLLSELELVNVRILKRTVHFYTVSQSDLDYVGHVYARTEGLVGVLISDKDYPIRVAYSLLTKILDEFIQRYPASKYKSATSLEFPELHSVFVFIRKY
jgi:Regulated-SNARE-like domain